MPYIKAEKREELKTRAPSDAGELNYWLTMHLWESWNGGHSKEAAISGALIEIGMYLGRGPGYAEYNEVMGVLDDARREMIRRADDFGMGDFGSTCAGMLADRLYDYTIANYEDSKIEENGDMPFATQ